MDQQFNDLPLPDGEQSWQKMKVLLDEDDKNKKPFPLLLRSCAGIGFLLLLVAAVTWFIVRPEKWWQKKVIAEQAQKGEKQKQSVKNKILPTQSTEKQNTRSNIPTTNVNTEVTTINNSVPTENNTKNVSSHAKQNDAVVKIKSKNVSSKFSKKNEKVVAKKTNNKNIKTGKSSKTKIDATKPNIVSSEKLTEGTNNVKIVPSEKKNTTVADSTAIVETSISTNKNTSQQADSAKPAITSLTDSVIKADEKKKEKSKAKFIVSAGVGLQQQIPFSGQKAVPYDYYGRKNSISDYIPSIYLRFEKEKKWFVLGEFRYGAPQSIKDFSYSRQTKVDTTNVVTTTYRLKKTYYHQLPVSFNYYVLTNWSVGIGSIYSRFHGAVTEREVKSKNIQTQVETLSREIVQIKHFTDSFLYKTQVHLLLQTEYQWKRFTFGLRYTKDVQPYIKYTKPDGVINTEKNQTMQLLVRYRLWSSKKG
jgi:hypothetical protein